MYSNAAKKGCFHSHAVSIGSFIRRLRASPRAVVATSEECRDIGRVFCVRDMEKVEIKNPAERHDDVPLFRRVLALSAALTCRLHVILE